MTLIFAGAALGVNCGPFDAPEINDLWAALDDASPDRLAHAEARVRRLARTDPAALAAAVLELARLAHRVSGQANCDLAALSDLRLGVQEGGAL